MKDIVIVLIILGICHWYFNIRNKLRCITLVPECNDVDCIKQK